MTRDEALNVMGLDADATRAEVMAAYRELAQMMHPDKFGGNKRLRERAERQMVRLNQARDALLKGAAGSKTGNRGTARPGSPSNLEFEATARARAAETARLAVVAQARTMRERRRGMVGMAVVAAAIFVLFRARGIASLASMLTVWGTIDAVMLTNQINVLQKRSRELLELRDRALAVAEQARGL